MMWAGYLNDVCVGPAFVRLIVLCVFEQHFVHVSAGILEELVWVIENDEGDLAVTQHTELIGFLHQTKLSFGEGYLWREENDGFGQEKQVSGLRWDIDGRRFLDIMQLNPIGNALT